MKRIMTVCASLLALTLLWSVPVLAVSVGFESASATVGLGDSFSVDVVVSDLGSDIVSAFDMDATYDPTVIAATDVTFGPMLGGGLPSSLQASDVSSPGVVDFREVSLLGDSALNSVQSGNDSFTLATLSFDAVGLGTSQLGFVFDEWNDIKGSDNMILQTDPGTGTVNVVPIPGAVWLFASGLVGLAGIRRKLRG